MMLSVTSATLLKVVAAVCQAMANLWVFLRSCVGSADACRRPSAAGMPLQRPFSVVSVLCERVNESFLVLAACASSAATPAAPRISSNAAPSCGAATSWATTSTAGMPYHAPDDGLSPRGRFGKGSHAEMAVKADDPCGARRSSKPRSIVGSLSSRAPSSTSSTGSREAGSVGAGV